MNVERQLTRVRFMTERTRDHVEQIGEKDFFRIDADRAGLDLRQIQDVANKVEEVCAGPMNGPSELDLLSGQIAFRFVVSCWPRIKIELSGVRSSCDMLARNSDLYLEVSASSVAFSSSARRACSISR